MNIGSTYNQHQLKIMYLSHKFQNCDSIEKFYFDVFIKKASNIKGKNFQFMTLVDILGYNPCEYLFKQNEIDEQIRRALIHLYFYLFKIKIRNILKSCEEIESTDQMNDVLSIISSLFSNRYLLKFKHIIECDFDAFLDEVIDHVFKLQHATFLSKFTFLYDMMVSIDTPLKPYEDLVDFLQNTKKQTYDVEKVEKMYYHCIFIFKDRYRFTYDQHLFLFRLIKETLIFEHHYMFKLFCVYYRERITAFAQYIRFINDFIVNFRSFQEKNEEYDKKCVRRWLYKMIVSCIRYNKINMKCSCMDRINNMIYIIYQNMHVVTEATFLKIIHVYFKHYNNVLKLVNMLKSHRDQRYVEIKKSVFDIIDDSFILSQRDKNKIRTILAIKS